MNNLTLENLKHMLRGHQQRVKSIGDELLSDLNDDGLGSTKELQAAVVHLSRIVDDAKTLKENVLGMFET